MMTIRLLVGIPVVDTRGGYPVSCIECWWVAVSVQYVELGSNRVVSVSIWLIPADHTWSLIWWTCICMDKPLGLAGWDLVDVCCWDGGRYG